MVENVSIGEGQPIRRVLPNQPHVAAEQRPREPFDAVMRKEIEKLNGVRFSAHALQRLCVRNINLSAEDRARIVEAIDSAQAKGGRDSLILMRGAALVVSVENRTVVTVLDREETRGNVFTNIDSAVIVEGDERGT
jgi:flagellar operon protein